MKKFSDEYFEKAVQEATKAAQKAGDDWMENAEPKYVVTGYEDSPLLDLCGNAHVRIDDGRTKFSKFLVKKKKFGAVTVPLETTHRFRQEHGLKVSMANAALKVLSEDFGIKKLYVWSYID